MEAGDGGKLALPTRKDRLLLAHLALSGGGVNGEAGGASMRRYIIGAMCMGFGGMLAFTIRGGLPAASAFLRAVTVFACAESLGGVESLVAHPASMTHATYPPEVRAASGISDGLVRLSAGLEDSADLLADVAQALDAAHATDAAHARSRRSLRVEANA